MHPECLNFLLCDDVFRDIDTKKTIAVGIFDTLFATQVPALHPQLCFFITLTDGHGNYELSLAIENAQNGDVILELKGPLMIADPLKTADITLKVHHAVFPVFGKYWACLKIGGTLIKQRPFFVVQSKPKKGRRATRGAKKK